MQRRGLQRKASSHVQDAIANTITLLRLTRLYLSNLIILSKVSLHKIKIISWFIAKITLKSMLCAIAATIELCSAKIVLMKSTQIT